MEVNTSSITDPTNMYNYMNRFIADPTILIVACLVILVFAVFFSSLGNDATSQYFRFSDQYVRLIVWKLVWLYNCIRFINAYCF